MKRFLLYGIVGMLTLLFISACGVLQEPEEASGPIEAIPLEVEEQEAEPTAEPTEAEAEVTEPEPEMEEGAETPAAEEPAAEPTDEPAAEEPAGSGLVIFRIGPPDAKVSFELDEELRGQPKTVVGTTDQLAGEIAVDYSDLSTAQVGTIQINARALVTDNDFRNRAIQNDILDTGDYEFITFAPTAVNGLPASVGIGETVNFSIAGDLTIRDFTNEAVFEVEATPVSETQISGTASTIVNRADFDLIIPNVPNVANVEEEVELYIDFVANAG